MGKCQCGRRDSPRRRQRQDHRTDLRRAKGPPDDPGRRPDVLLGAAQRLYVDDGVKPVFEVRTRLGREIKTTITHPFLTVEGWRKLGEFSVGDHVAVPPDPVGRESLGTHRVKLLAYMLGDGNMTGGVPRFTNANPAVREDFIEAVGEFGGLGVREENSGGTRTPTLCVRADRAVVRRYRQAFSRSLRQAVVEARRPAAEIAGVRWSVRRH